MDNTYPYYFELSGDPGYGRGKKIRALFDTIGTPEPYVTSLDTYKRTTQVKAYLAAQLIVDGTHRLATQIEISNFLSERERRVEAQKPPEAAKLSITGASMFGVSLDQRGDARFTFGTGSTKKTPESSPNIPQIDYEKEYNRLVADLKAFTFTIDALKPGLNKHIADMVWRTLTQDIARSTANNR